MVWTNRVAYPRLTGGGEQPSRNTSSIKCQDGARSLQTEQAARTSWNGPREAEVRIAERGIKPGSSWAKRTTLAISLQGYGEVPLPQQYSLPHRRTGFDSGFSHTGIMPDDAAGRQVFPGISRFSRPCILTLLHTRLAPPPPSALKTSMLTAAQIPLLYSQLTNRYSPSSSGGSPSLALCLLRAALSLAASCCCRLWRASWASCCFAAVSCRSLLRASCCERRCPSSLEKPRFSLTLPLIGSPITRASLARRYSERQGTTALRALASSTMLCAWTTYIGSRQEENRIKITTTEISCAAGRQGRGGSTPPPPPLKTAKQLPAVRRQRAGSSWETNLLKRRRGKLRRFPAARPIDTRFGGPFGTGAALLKRNTCGPLRRLQPPSLPASRPADIRQLHSRAVVAHD
ncbi:hypothetical protein PR048_009507 [Dryococelus australis]|uniref:Uncharacterized protein n=1 Tax=Dryococelus australis TaxID=614101 RepID=A0ABQ9I0G7_9NEOP|nr:hypothetical protein PR048_009507 [Dryococelus australis]